MRRRGGGKNKKKKEKNQNKTVSFTEKISAWDLNRYSQNSMKGKVQYGHNGNEIRGKEIKQK